MLGIGLLTGGYGAERAKNGTYVPSNTCLASGAAASPVSG